MRSSKVAKKWSKNWPKNVPKNEPKTGPKTAQKKCQKMSTKSAKKCAKKSAKKCTKKCPKKVAESGRVRLLTLTRLDDYYVQVPKELNTPDGPVYPIGHSQLRPQNAGANAPGQQTHPNNTITNSNNNHTNY